MNNKYARLLSCLILTLSINQGSAADPNDEIIGKITKSIMDVCQSPSQGGKYWDVKGGGGGDVQVKFWKLADIGVKGKAEFSQGEWEHVQQVLREQQAQENANYRDCAKELTPLFLDRFAANATPATSATVTYPPPRKKGDIYAVINKNTEQILHISLKWGKWNEGRQIDLCNYDGLVLHLKHINDDSLDLKVTTNGNVVKEPYQGEVPREWDNERYMRVSW